MIIVVGQTYQVCPISNGHQILSVDIVQEGVERIIIMTNCQNQLLVSIRAALERYVKVVTALRQDLFVGLDLLIFWFLASFSLHMKSDVGCFLVVEFQAPKCKRRVIELTASNSTAKQEIFKAAAPRKAIYSYLL